jgi:polysaccharide pyruvyl transferase WcaK-like protein
MKIVLVNVHSDNNRGSCALTWAALDLVRRSFPDAQVTIVPLFLNAPVSRAFRHTIRRYPEVAFVQPPFDGANTADAVRLAKLARLLSDVYRQGNENDGNESRGWIRAISEADLVVVRGGVTLHNSEGTIRGDLRFLIRLLPLLSAAARRKPIVMLGAQTGPFPTVLSKRAIRHVFRATSAVLARDAVSASEALNVVPPERVALAADVAFSLVPEAADPSLFTRHGLDPSLPTLALVIGSELRKEEVASSHASVLAAAANALIAEGLISQVMIVVQADEDRAASLRLAALLGPGARVVDEDLNPMELASLYAGCRMLVSSRLHAVILSLISGTPAVSIAPGVTFKERAVLGVLGLEDLCVPSTAPAEQVVDTCIRIAADHAELAGVIDARVRAARAKIVGTSAELLRTACV